MWKNIYGEHELKKALRDSATMIRASLFWNGEIHAAVKTAYARGNNHNKHDYVVDFNRMWKFNIISPDMKKEKCIQGLCKLRDMLRVQLSELEFAKNSHAAYK